ncbi:MAG TPA: polysaccharide deacetylase family protein [Candidatus Polarisedimenticolia bacterium]|jgi:peptidoglycan/xylan/chitin deacetylase (PgdA/CDA1 family)|nr:polysaccharide deacetylase family protein [Candidatus Polarisedimenticolia bacterium]
MMRQPATRGAVLAYHEVMPESNYAYCVTASAFAEHLRLFDSLRKSNSQGAQVTFDDGEQSQYHKALPLLAEYGIKATYFVTPGLIGTAAKFLGWDELRALQAAGHFIQSHGWSHKFLTFCSEAELAHELRESKQFLEDHLGNAVEQISVPGGRWDRRVITACAAAGYRRVYVSDPWVETEISGVEVIGRFMVRRNTTIAELAKIVERDRDALRKLKLRSQLRQSLVGLLGDSLYHRLWCCLTGYNDFEAARQDMHS